jgi:hypothetical protein
MNHSDPHWQRLAALARQAPDGRDTAAPYGFATRVAAVAGAMPAVTARAVFERLALRGLLVAAGFGLAAGAFSFSTLTVSPQMDAYAAADSVYELLDIS